MFNKGQIVRISRSKLINFYIRKYPLISRDQAFQDHEYFFTRILDRSNGFIVCEDNPYSDDTLIYPIWKDQKYNSPLTSNFTVPRECLKNIDSVLSISFIDLSCYV